MRILFVGTPAVAVPTLKAVASRFEVAAVLTNTDKPGPRGRTLVPPPIKEEALALGLDVLQFDRLGKAARDAVSPYGCDTLLCFAYGRIFGVKFLSLFSGERLNIHPSLLPALRGPSPIQGTILSQLETGGISIQRLAAEMDSGDILATVTYELFGDETTASLTERVAELAAPLACEALERIKEGRALFTPQRGEATFTTLIDASMAKLDFNTSTKSLHAQIRAMMPWPKAETTFAGQRLFITGVYGSIAQAGGDPAPDGAVAGTVVQVDKRKGIGIVTGDGILWVTSLQLEKRKQLDALSFFNGNRHLLGSRLG